MPGRPGEGGVFFLEKASLDSATKRRMLFVLFIFLAVCFVALTVRLFYVQIMQHELYQAKAICSNWKNQNEDVYAYLMDMLLR